ncbi:hypothetical protein VTO42DRAFT_4088 [Malbranchea cinnamomea]
MPAAGPAVSLRAAALSTSTTTTTPTRSDPKPVVTGVPKRLAPEARKRTNSLGWAHSDCHTCAAGHFVCDRRRPRCDSCTSRGVLCGGYVQVLNWQPGVASRGKMKGRQLKVDPSTALQQGGDIVKPSAFLFVHEHGQGERIPAKKRKSKVQRTQPSPTPSAAAATSIPQRKSPVLKGLLPVEAAPASTHADQGARTAAVPHHDPPVKAHATTSRPGRLPRPMNSLHSLPHQVVELLSFYEWQFARTTITCDVKINPWQCSIPMVYETHCLMNAVTALSKRHRAHCFNDSEGVEVLILKDRALSLFASGLQSIPCEALIATILALIGLEYAETGFSSWTVHLRGAYWILESAGGLERAAHSPTLRCQIAMLLWYDITSALLSRRGPVFPLRYLDVNLSWPKLYPGEWTYMSLNGCPDALLLSMYHVASSAPLAEQMTLEDVQKLESSVHGVDAETGLGNETATTPSTPLTIVADMEASPGPKYMSPYVYPSISVAKQSITTPSVIQASDESASLVKCWRLSILLYIRQVFYRPECSAGRQENDHHKQDERRRALAQTIIRLVSNMPIESNWQKQCLLPIVLAGFELRQPTKCIRTVFEDGMFKSTWVSEPETGEDSDTTLTLRDWVKAYCQRWKTLTGLWVFGTAAELLTRLWDRMDAAHYGVVLRNASLSSVYRDVQSSAGFGASQAQDPCHNERHRRRNRVDPQSIWWGDLVTEDMNSSEAGENGEGYLFG